MPHQGLTFQKLHPKLVCQSGVGAAEHLPGEPWHLQVLADGLQVVRRDLLRANRPASAIREDEVIVLSEIGPLAQSFQNRV